ncbi:metalloprotease TldD [Paraferrimonas sp. SM1919]|uniref:metalloprotease TldD n=1 Tax=Paraferrimonas sp. SM1919 TaxID=2662263 RepID=UPI0013D3A7B5|nr:metalloprotease TldD [Paraferrimonas sp. SM1919]
MTIIENVANELLLPGNLDFDKIQNMLELAHHHQIDFADLYFQDSRNESWVLEDGIIKEGSFHIERGVGVRAIAGEKTGFSYADEISEATLQQAVLAARGIEHAGNCSKPQTLTQVSAKVLYDGADPINAYSQTKKIQLLQQIDRYIRTLDERIVQVVVSLSAVYERILVAASDSTLAADIRPLVRLNCSVVLEQNGQRERGGSGMGGRYGYEPLFVTDNNGDLEVFEYAREAVRQAQINLDAVEAPAGELPVVLGNGWPGVLLHEAVGHGLEGDFNRKGSSAFSGRIGEKVAAKGVTVVDDGTLEGRRGSLSIDDEGTPSRYNTLIEDGILKGYMQDKLNGRLMGGESTGNGRRESYAHLPMPRMTNTYMLAGKDKPEDMIKAVENGIYAANFGGGQVDITSGKFVFSASEAYLIENGEITKPIKGATLIGNGPESMARIAMIGNDLALDKGVGVCGKDGQSVPVGVGQPSLLIDGMTVGGTA